MKMRWKIFKERDGMITDCHDPLYCIL